MLITKDLDFISEYYPYTPESSWGINNRNPGKIWNMGKDEYCFL